MFKYTALMRRVIKQVNTFVKMVIWLISFCMLR